MDRIAPPRGHINSDLRPHNAIKSAFIGGGYYSGFVLDCDGTIICQANRGDWP